ncbi:hypothetical protein MtrunA17_Chr1g0168331 [Medicago truncatula]|uniref:Uncharacterized protein n=1 Tax=Medicago truncatula TaxID=3880 RepID=G7I625_MEDTR|nr:hypothetical protein MTR_1g044640 [Medicago truncatula]RHN78657.1 hypothetical protein MtrunA17_Chr1g0168331 [Medicago truncatula]
MCQGKRKVIHQGVGFKAKPFSIKGKCVKKRKFVSVNVVAITKIMIDWEKEKEERVKDHQTPYKKLVGPFVDDVEVKKTLSNWRQMKGQVRQDQREAAQLKLEKIQNTACFNESIDVMFDFHKLIGCSN